MSNFMSLWQKIRALSDDDLNKEIEKVHPCEGKLIDFFDIKVVDIDALEFLWFIREERYLDPNPIIQPTREDLVHPFID